MVNPMIRFHKTVLFLVLLLPIISSCSGFAGISTPSTTTATTNIKPYCELAIDYSAATEFLEEYYDCPGYFARDQAKEYEAIYNGREGYIDYQDGGETLKTPSLSQCGFELVHTPTLKKTMDWNDIQSIRDHYLPHVEQALLSSLGEDQVADIYFWNPTIRKNVEQAGPRTNDVNEPTPVTIYAGTAHIDSDVNIYPSLDDFLKVVRANIVPGTKPFPVNKGFLQKHNRRFAIYNAWRNIGETPIQRAPLAVRPMRYQDPQTAFPIGKPNFEQSPWYVIPEMQPQNEVLLFAQYDRDAAQPADVWHCALKNVCLTNNNINDINNQSEEVPPRKSFDIRAFVVFQEKERIPKHRDRLAQRITSIDWAKDFKEK